MFKDKGQKRVFIFDFPKKLIYFFLLFDDDKSQRKNKNKMNNDMRFYVAIYVWQAIKEGKSIEELLKDKYVVITQGEYGAFLEAPDELDGILNNEQITTAKKIPALFDEPVIPFIKIENGECEYSAFTKQVITDTYNACIQ